MATDATKCKADGCSRVGNQACARKYCAKCCRTVPSAAHDVWELAGAPTWTTAAPLPDARNHGGGAATGGLFYAIAGRHGWNESSGDVADVDALDPASGSWTSRAAIPTARSEIPGAT